MTDVKKLLGEEAASLLEYKCTTVPKENLHLPGPDFVDRVLTVTDRPVPVLRNMQAVFDNGRLGGTGYLSILPVDQGIEHSAGASFAPNPIYFDPENIVKLALEGGCNAVASTLGVLGAVSRKYAYKIPFIVKINHNEFLTYPNTFDQRLSSMRTASACSPCSGPISGTRPSRRRKKTTTSPPTSPDRRTTSRPR